MHGPETAVRFLMDQPWPKGSLYRATLELYYAQSLVNYSRAYGWEIGQREKVASGGPVDLKAWTRDQIYDAAAAAYARVHAVSCFDSPIRSQGASAEVTLISPEGISLVIEPSEIEVARGEAREIAVTVAGTSDPRTHWLNTGSVVACNGIYVNDDNLCTVDSDAPLGTCNVVIYSVVDPSKMATLEVTITE